MQLDILLPTINYTMQQSELYAIVLAQNSDGQTACDMISDSSLLSEKFRQNIKKLYSEAKVSTLLYFYVDMMLHKCDNYLVNLIGISNERSIFKHKEIKS